ncbi:hypothetical protein HC251_14070 [Iamia sp. SCSIO 61187]|uniref:hypothetical protein n=1 Tax=Iamia sp. SCSIO 61187 TaxID=2722752 RepID=UPI001C62A538|nr:hypothetical protein [Iamia sp. SCSIO 61187]QYG93438.1 hypothetical protein HC251_14070 [Iamia sp. SCSIO 61187]
MREVDGILDFLEEYDLLRPPESVDDDVRIGRVGPDEQIAEVDWAYLTSGDFVADDLQMASDGGLTADVLGGLGIARSNAELDRRQSEAIPPPWDSCAWYAPMHYYGPRWGIYIREDCLEKLMIEISWFAWDSPRTHKTVLDLRLAAFFVLFLHEHFHHKLEGFGIRLALADRAAPDHYLRYDRAVYRATVGTDDNIEEALANADAYQRLGDQPYHRLLPSAIRRALRRWMKWRFMHVDPPGYRMARHYLTPGKLADGAARLQTQVLEARVAPTSNPAHWQAGPNMLRSVFPITSDIYLVIPPGSTASFRLSARPYTVSVRQARKWLKDNGFAELPGRGKGDHERYERSDGLQVGLDGGARELSRNIERTIAKALGVSQRELRLAVSEGRPL